MLAVGAASGLAFAGVGAGAATAGLAIAAIGIAAAAQVPAVRDAFSAMKKSVTGTFKGLGDAMAPTLQKFAGEVATTFAQIAPELRSMLSTLAPYIGQFGTQLLGAFKSLVPYLSQVAQAVGPVITAFGAGLTPLFKGLGSFLSDIAAAANQLAPSFTTLLALTGKLLTVLGPVLSTLAQIGGPVLLNLFRAVIPVVQVLGQALQALAPAIGPLTGVVVTLVKALAPILPVAGQLAGILAGALTSAISALMPGIRAIVAALGPTLTPVMRALAPIIGLVAQFIGGLLKAIAPLLPVIGQLVSVALSALMAILRPLMPVFLQIAQILVTALKPVFAALAPVIAVVGQVLGTILGTALKAIMPLFRALLPVIGQLVATILPPLIPLIRLVGQVFQALMPVINPLVQILVAVLVPVLKLVGVIFTALAPLINLVVKAVLLLLTPMAQLLGAGLRWVAFGITWITQLKNLKTIWNSVWGLLKSIGGWFAGPFVNFFVSAWAHIWSAVISPLQKAWNAVASWTGTMVGKVKSLWQGMLDRVVGIWHAFHDNVIAPIVNFFTKSIPAAAGTLAGAVKGLWQSIYNRVLGIWTAWKTYVLYPIGNFFTKTVPGWAGTLAGKVKGLWQGIYDRLLGIWNALKTYVLNPIAHFFTKTIPSAAGTLAGKVKGLWGDMVGGVKGSWDWLKKKVINPIKDFFTKTIPEWTGTLVGKMKDLWTDMRDGVGQIWAGLKGLAAKPIVFVLETVIKNGLLGAYDKIRGIIPGLPSDSGLKSGLGTLIGKLKGTYQKKATGGAIHGPGTGTSDSIPAYLSNGEHVWTAKEVRAVGGQQNMLSLRRAALRGQLYPAYAKGGPVTHVGAPGFFNGGYVPGLITKIAQRLQNGIRMSSGYRPGSYSLEGNRDYHSQGLAADLAGSQHNMDELAAKFYLPKLRTYLLEEIHAKAGTGRAGWYVKNGKAVGSGFYGAEVPIHRDHVHIAMTAASAQSMLQQLIKGASGGKGKGGSMNLWDYVKKYYSILGGLFSGGAAQGIDFASQIAPKLEPVKKLIGKIPGAGTLWGGMLTGFGKLILDKTTSWLHTKADESGGGGGDFPGGGSGSGKDFFTKVLGGLGIKTTSGALNAFYAVTNLEGDNNRHNPLNSVVPSGGSHAFNSVGVQAYPSFNDGVNGTIKLLRGSPWRGVVSALKGGNMTSILNAFARVYSSWDPGVHFFTSPSIFAKEARRRFAKGTSSAPPGWALVGERGPELVKMRGGETVLPTGKTLQAVNHTGRSEYGVSQAQVNALAARAAAQISRQVAPVRGDIIVNARTADLKGRDLRAILDRQYALDGLLTP
jgi:phage-related protein